MLSRKQVEHIENTEDLAASTKWRLVVGDDDLTGRVETIGYGPREDAPGQLLEATLKGIPTSVKLEGQRVFVDLYIDGIRYRDFTGKVAYARTRGGETTLRAGTGGRFRERVKLLERKEFLGVYPSTAAYDVLSRLPYERYEVPRVDKPLIYRTVENGIDSRYDDLDSVATVLDDIEEYANLRVLDDELNTAVGYTKDPLAETAPVKALIVGEDIEDFEADTPEERYSEVLVYERVDGAMVKLAAAPVEYPDPAMQPPAGAILEIESTDTSVNKVANAKARAIREAEKLRYEEGEVKFTTLYIDPRLVRTKTVIVSRLDYSSGIISRYIVTFHTHWRDPKRKTCEYSGIGKRIATIHPDRPKVGTIRRSDSVGTPLVGINSRGVPYVSTELAGVSVSGDVVTVDTAAIPGVTFEDTADPDIVRMVY